VIEHEITMGNKIEENGDLVQLKFDRKCICCSKHFVKVMSPKVVSYIAKYRNPNIGLEPVRLKNGSFFISNEPPRKEKNKASSMKVREENTPCLQNSYI